MSTNFEALKAEIEKATIEAEKFFGEKHNAQAGKRFRANMKVVADLAKALRKEVSELKASRAAEKA